MAQFTPSKTSIVVSATCAGATGDAVRETGEASARVAWVRFPVLLRSPRRAWDPVEIEVREMLASCQ